MSDRIIDSIIVRGAIADVYRIWADFKNFPLFMKYIESVTMTGERMSHWVMSGPLGATVEWDAETTRLEENQRIAWNSKDNSAVKTSGQVTFTELGPNETEISVMMHYAPPAGKAGDALAFLVANPEGRVHEDLQRFKQHVESTAQRLHEGTPMRW